MTPRVSVVVPCYNQGRYLDEAIGSVLAQTFQDLEILVVDDGSTDPDTRRLLEGYDRPKTRVLRGENRGLPGARNAGIRAAAGEYVCCLDADDVLEPALLEKSVAVLDARPEVTFVSHWLRTFGDETWDWTPVRCDFPALLDANTVNGAAPVRRQALLDAGLFDETMQEGCEDWDLWITLVERGATGTILPEFLFRYRRRPDSMSRVMARAGGNVDLYEGLARKHEAAYRRHLEHLYARRVMVAADLARHVLELRLEEQRWLGPELRKKREHAAALRGKAARARHAVRLDARAAAADESAANAERQAASAERHAARAVSAEDLATRRERETIRLGARVAELIAEKTRLAGDLAVMADGRRQEIEALRQSWSWRIAAPLRAVHGWLARRREG